MFEDNLIFTKSRKAYKKLFLCFYKMNNFVKTNLWKTVFIENQSIIVIIIIT